MRSLLGLAAVSLRLTRRWLTRTISRRHTFIARSAEDPATARENQCFFSFYVTEELLDDCLIKKL